MNRGTAVPQPGRRLFVGASIGLLIVAGLHTLGQLGPPPPDPEFLRLYEMMQRVRLDLGLGMQPTMEGVFSSISFTMSITLVALGVLGLIVACAEDPTGRTLRQGIVALTIAVGALVILYAHYRIPPPLISFSVIELVFLAALVRAVRGSGRTRVP